MKMTDPPANGFEELDGNNASEGRDPATGRFLKGYSGGSKAGRKKGARARWSEAFMADIEAAWKEQGRSVIDRAMFHDPAGTLKALIAILPKHAKLEITNPVEEISDELLAIMLDLAEQRLAEQRLAESPMIEGTAMRNVTPTLPPPLADAPPTEGAQRAEALRRNLHDQHDALAAVKSVIPAPALPLPHPVGKPFPAADYEVERRNLAKLHDDINPEDLF